jgi:agmatine deiminase
MPAEWEPHEATWIAWPHQRSDWPGKFAAIPWVYTEIARHLHQCEIVRILVNDTRMEQRARQMLARAGVDLGRVEFYPFPTNRVWIRDYGPLFIRNEKEIAVTDWGFNAWAKYPDWQLDNAIP